MSDIKLSILIPTLPQRKAMFDALMAELQRQIADKPVEVLHQYGEGETGTKRNDLLRKAQGEYVCFVDDDDVVADDYIYCILSALESDPDCCSLNGIITTDGKNPKRFIHSIQYDKWFEKDDIYYRPPNHLNVIRSSIAKQFQFPALTFGEDRDWSMQIAKSGLLKNEAIIDETLYYYKYVTRK